MKKALLCVAMLAQSHLALAQTPVVDGPAMDQTASSLSKIMNSCPGKTIKAIPSYHIPAGVLVGRLEPGGGDTDGNPTSYQYHDNEGHTLFLPADRVQLLFCTVQKHQRENPQDAGYSLTFNPPPIQKKDR